MHHIKEPIIKWNSLRDLPNNSGIRITVKDMSGELHNTITKRGQFGAYIVGFQPHDLQGWIPNNEAA